ncbi:hypothetical protein ISS08_02165 [Candidatus Pacearchaeota archaeon]|nr:hypothetical protein [Candidatus Pacearchaeota archaeon]
MKKLGLLLLFIMMIFPLVSAAAISVEKISSNDVLVIGSDKPVVVKLNLSNSGASTTFEFYNLVGFQMSPNKNIQINQGDTKEIDLTLSPIGTFDYRGFYTLKYYIRAEDKTDFPQSVTFSVLDLEDIFEVGSGEVDPESRSIEIYLKNLVNFDVGEVNAKFSSAFFDFEKTFELGPNEKANFTIQLNQDDFNQLMAGFYTLDAEINVGDKTVFTDGIIQFLEKDILKITQKDYGFIINTQIIQKVNEGNTIESSETFIEKNIFSRLFTTFSPSPTIVQREGFKIQYTWINDIGPGETLNIEIKTNWLFPFILILLIIVIVVLAKLYSGTAVVLRKRVSFVKTKGGEFALKVSLFATAKKYVERVNIVDRLPAITKLYERFGGEQPSKVNSKARRLEYDFEKLEAGETRVMSYIIYSKIGVMGRFALPSAIAIFEKEGKIHETQSNKAFFVTEQSAKDADKE